MIKYDVKNFEAFFSSIVMGTPVYIEKIVWNIPIPELQGIIYPLYQNGGIKIITITIDDNPTMDKKEFKRMIVSRKFAANAMGNQFTLNDTLSIYNFFKDKYNLFVLDTTYDIENNN